MYHEPSRVKRRKKLLEKFYFNCFCAACVDNYEMVADPLMTEMLEHKKFLNLNDIIKNFKDNCKTMQAEYGHYPCKLLWRLQCINLYLLEKMTDLSFWKF
jgi:hypothetical protein